MSVPENDVSTPAVQDPGGSVARIVDRLTDFGRRFSDVLDRISALEQERLRGPSAQAPKLTDRGASPSGLPPRPSCCSHGMDGVTPTGGLA